MTSSQPSPTEDKRVLAGLELLKVAETMDWVNMLIYGDPGVGKTMLACSAMEVEVMKPVLHIDIEGGTKTIRNIYPDIDVVRIRDIYDDKGRLRVTAWQKLQDLYEAIRREGQWKTVIIDSLSEAQKVSMGSILSDVSKKDPDRDPDIPALRDWGKSSEQVRRMVRGFRDLEMHTIFTAHGQTNKDETTGALLIKPSLPGKLADEVAGFLDIVLYMYAKPEGPNKEVVRRVLSQPTGKQVAKDRSGSLPTIMEAPTMAQIAALALD